LRLEKAASRTAERPEVNESVSVVLILLVLLAGLFLRPTRDGQHGE
jgi:hypothetical protein